MMSKIPSRIVFSGADGSGKTTLSKLCLLYFTSKGISTGIHWFRGSHLLASFLLRFFRRFKVFNGYCNPYYKVCIPNKLKPLWIHIEFWSMIPHVLIRFFLSKFHRILICDRGLADFIVWIITTLNAINFLFSIYCGFLLRIAKRDFTIYLHADLNTLISRTDVSREFLSKELTIYNVLMRYLAVSSIDTSKCKPIEALVETIKYLERNYGLWEKGILYGCFR